MNQSLAKTSNKKRKTTKLVKLKVQSRSSGIHLNHLPQSTTLGDLLRQQKESKNYPKF